MTCARISYDSILFIVGLYDQPVQIPIDVPGLVRVFIPPDSMSATETQFPPPSSSPPGTVFEFDWARSPSRLPSKQAIDGKFLSAGPCEVTYIDLAIIRKIVEAMLPTILFVTFFTYCYWSMTTKKGRYMRYTRYMYEIYEMYKMYVRDVQESFL